MKYRVVEGYNNTEYTFSSSVTKTVKLSAHYEYNTPAEYDSLWKHNQLNVAIMKKEKILFGLFTHWKEYKTLYCSYSSDNFYLDEKVILPSGTYGFKIYRNEEDAFWGDLV